VFLRLAHNAGLHQSRIASYTPSSYLWERVAERPSSVLNEEGKRLDNSTSCPAEARIHWVLEINSAVPGGVEKNEPSY